MLLLQHPTLRTPESVLTNRITLIWSWSCLENPYGQRNLVGYSPWGHKKSDTTERLTLRFLKCAHFPSLCILNFTFSSVTESVL